MGTERDRHDREGEHPEALVRTSRWEIDPRQSEIRFSIRNMMISTVKGAFTSFRGHLILDETHRTPAVVEVEIDADSIDTGLEQRDLHLRSGDFFDVESHPKILFVSRRFEPIDSSHYRITGDLRMHGVTREITLEATFEGVTTDPWGNERAMITATARLNRHDFGLTWNRPIEAGGLLVGDTVRIWLDIQAVRQS